MAFNSFPFWFIFPLIFGVYWLIPNKYNQVRKIILIIVSYLLYMNWNPSFAIVLLYVTFLTFWGGYTIGNQVFKTKKHAVWIFSILGLFPLLLFKYYNFVNDCISTALSSVGLHFTLPGLNCAIPIGISFFSFQAIGYMLDVYHGRIKHEKDVLDYVLFVCFFPQISSGPISTADNLMPQIKSIHKFDYNQGKEGLKNLLWGTFIKLVIADRLGLFVDTVYTNYMHYNGTTCFLASLFYSIQIYCDFAGYSLMAVGIAKTLGFNLVNNFSRPYLSISITDFWKRWHISLTRWLTRQIYIPLGGNRCNKMKMNWNILITFLISGIWHGANWTFIFWGGIHGALQIFEKALGLQKHEGKLFPIGFIRIGITFMLVNIAWVFFRMSNICDAFKMIGKWFIDIDTPDIQGLGITMAISITILVFKEILEEWFSQKHTILNTSIIRWSVYVFLFCYTLAFGVLDGGQFIYANF